MKWHTTSWPELAAELERIEREQMSKPRVEEQVPVVAVEQPAAAVGARCCGHCKRLAADANHRTNQHELDLETIRELSKRIAQLEQEARVDAQTKVALQQEIERLKCNARYCDPAAASGVDTSVIYNQH